MLTFPDPHSYSRRRRPSQDHPAAAPNPIEQDPLSPTSQFFHRRSVFRMSAEHFDVKRKGPPFSPAQLAGPNTGGMNGSSGPDTAGMYHTAMPVAWGGTSRNLAQPLWTRSVPIIQNVAPTTSDVACATPALRVEIRASLTHLQVFFQSSQLLVCCRCFALAPHCLGMLRSKGGFLAFFVLSQHFIQSSNLTVCPCYCTHAL
jgi:hypothetical protein